MIFKAQARRNAIRMVGERSSSFDLARGRIVLLNGLFVLAYMLLAARAIDLSVIQAHVGGYEGGVEQPGPAASGPARGNIYDRNGVLLATTLKTASLYADTRLIANPKKTAQGLAGIFPQLTYGEVLQKLQSGRRFIWIERNITPADQYKVLELGEPGLDFRFERRRIYPHVNLAAHFLGFTNIDNKGQAGIERSFERLLSGGESLTLTLDVRLQHALRREIGAAMDDFSARAGAGVIMDVESGEILAAVSLPDFNPHEPGSADKDQIFNRLTLGVYELGSVFKIFSTAALLESRDLPMSTTFDASEPIRAGRFTISDYHAEERELTLPEVFMYSSNIGSAMMGEAVGTESLRDFYRDIGLLDPLDFEIPEVSAPLVPEPWGRVHTMTAAYGHGIATTPLQLTAAAASVVNGGVLVRPRLVAGNESASAVHTGIGVIRPETSEKIRRLMRLVVTDGTGKKADVPGYLVGGKTGTAEKPGGKGYSAKKLISSFIGVFPIDSPRYAVFVMIDEPRGNAKSFGYATAGWTAAPAVARVISSMASILGLEPKSDAAGRDIAAPLRRYIKEAAYEE